MQSASTRYSDNIVQPVSYTLSVPPHTQSGLVFIFMSFSMGVLELCLQRLLVLLLNR